MSKYETLHTKLKTNYFDSSYKQSDLERDLKTFAKQRFILGVITTTISIGVLSVMYMYFVSHNPQVTFVIDNIITKITS